MDEYWWFKEDLNELWSQATKKAHLELLARRAVLSCYTGAANVKGLDTDRYF